MSKRIRFLLMHLLLSIILSLILIAWVLLIWYPKPLDEAIGVNQIFLMMVAIDVILGPLLCFIVYKENKKTLKLDLSIIIIFQIIALSYGVFNIAQGRPVWIVYSVDRFELVRNNEVYEKNLQNANREYQQSSLLKPQYVATTFSKNLEERNRDLFDEVLAGVSIAQRPERYVPVETVQNQMKSRSKDLNLLDSFNSDSEVAKILAQYPSANAWLPLKANALDMVVLINKENAEVVKIVNLRPWN